MTDKDKIKEIVEKYNIHIGGGICIIKDPKTMLTNEILAWHEEEMRKLSEIIQSEADQWEYLNQSKIPASDYKGGIYYGFREAIKMVKDLLKESRLEDKGGEE